MLFGLTIGGTRGIRISLSSEGDDLVILIKKHLGEFDHSVTSCLCNMWAVLRMGPVCQRAFLQCPHNHRNIINNEQ